MRDASLVDYHERTVVFVGSVTSVDDWKMTSDLQARAGCISIEAIALTFFLCGSMALVYCAHAFSVT